jgi:high-affinity iron transporter
MRGAAVLRVAVLLIVWSSTTVRLAAQQTPSVHVWLDEITRDVQRARALAAAGDVAGAQRLVMRAYLDHFELIEGYYGPGAKYRVGTVATEVRAGEAAFHALLRSADASSVTANAAQVETQIERIRGALRGSGVPIMLDTNSETLAARGVVPPAAAATAEIKAILRQLADASAAYNANDAERALWLVEHAYLEGFEPLESRLPARLVADIEKRIHLELRPALKRKAPVATVTSLLGHVGADLVSADRFLAKGGSVAFAVVNSFIIIVREGLEAVLLVAALLTYLGAIGAQARHRRQIYAGVSAGVVASIGTWFLARTLLPISGANRELLEGITALTAVVVLMYVAHWLFQKTYIHDWKDYLRTRVGGAVTRGSGIAMAALAFAAVYREGFETVLFYQALAFDAGVGAILGGFIPGAILIVALGIAIIRVGVKLPLKKVFAGTNALLMYLAFVFIGKGIYNLQEAGLFSVNALPLPDHPALRQLFGFYPLVQTVAAQSAFILLLTGTYVSYRWLRVARPSASAQVQQTVPLPVPPAAVQPALRDSHRTRPATPSGDLPPTRARSKR